MQIIIISSNKAAQKHWHFTLKSTVLFLVVLIAASISIMMSIEPKANTSEISFQSAHVSMMESTINSNDEDPNQILEEYYVQRLGQLQAESIRLKALTEKIATMAGINMDVFVLDESPAQGGYDLNGNPVSLSDFKQELTSLEEGYQVQEDSLIVLRNYFITRDGIQSAIPQGSPSEEGWISSYYGKRIDPFNGKKVFHHGLDIAGRKGSPVSAVADGIVMWTGKRNGYGQLVEIDHGNGYITRYAHNETLISKVGDRVEKGQSIALMGSTGRSTGPHVHFEVLLDGKTINPYNFVKG